MQVVKNTFSPCVKMVFKEDIKNIFISRQNSENLIHLLITFLVVVT